MNKLVIILVIISALFTSQQSPACSCKMGKYQGFSSETETRILPRNAKGVLFTRFEFEKSEPIKNTNFIILDETTKKKISAKVIKLDLDFASPEKDSPRIQVIYRIEPLKPFIQSHKYRFTYKTTDKFDYGIMDSQMVSISKKSFPLEALSKPTFSFIGKAEVRTLTVEDSHGMCSRSIDAQVQEVAYDFPPEIKEFQNSILFFTAYSKDSNKYDPWLYRRSICSRDVPGRSAYAFGHDLIYIPTEDGQKGQLMRGIQYSIKGTWIAPEIEDKLHSSNEYSLSYPKEK